MKKESRIFWIGIALILSMSPGWTTPSSENQDLIPLAEKFLDHLIKNETQDAIGMLDETMTKALPPDKLEKMWPMLQKQVGKFEEVQATRREEQGVPYCIPHLPF